MAASIHDVNLMDPGPSGAVLLLPLDVDRNGQGADEDDGSTDVADELGAVWMAGELEDCDCQGNHNDSGQETDHDILDGEHCILLGVGETARSIT
ncbi:MAG: hypothetical protein JWN38_67 [Candidatus Saccharibacteria bacterium]|nr:hypothetical protein [Candidatus Saccharibacteria bacterium]